jgi:N-acetylmuramoyl-L-alanine amidase
MRVGLLLLLVLAFLGTLPTEARSVRVPLEIEVRSLDGVSLGRLRGALEDRVTYVALADLARLVRGSLRHAKGRLVLAARGKILEVRRNSPLAVVAGRTLELSGPVRLRNGTWLVPGDVLVRALPAFLGTGVHVTVAAAVAPSPRPVPRPPVAVVSAPSRPLVSPRPAPAPPAAPTTPAPPAAPTAALPRAPMPAPPVAPPPPPAVATPAPPAVALPPPPAVPAPPRPARPAAPPPMPSGEAGGEPGPPVPVKAGPVELRYRSYPTYTRVVLEGPVRFEPRLVESQGALVVPLVGLRAAGARGVRAVRDGLIATLEMGESRGHAALRVEFERAPLARKVFRLTDPPRLVLDFYRAPAAPAPSAAPARAPLGTIVLDAGHGGHDPGAIGAGGLQEKELTLDVTRRLAALLQEELGVRVVLTRTRDQFVALQERTALANRVKADLFVSVHVNAARGATTTGTETYFLSSEATDNAARAAAAFENKVIELEPGARGGTRDLLRSILWDLAQSEFQQESSRLAEALQDSLDRALRLPSRGVKQAPFYVLGGAAMPAVLVEVGFITNTREEERLQDEGYRDRIARALAAGLAAYKRRYEQKGGVVAER